jgi:hypothetical protein
LTKIGERLAKGDVVSRLLIASKRTVIAPHLHSKTAESTDVDQEHRPDKASAIIAAAIKNCCDDALGSSAEETARVPYDSATIATKLKDLAARAGDRRHAERLMQVACEFEGDLFRRVVSAASPRVLNIRDAVEIAGMSERSFYRIAPKVGEKDGRGWRIFEEKLFEHAKSLGKEDLWRSRAAKMR